MKRTSKMTKALLGGGLVLLLVLTLVGPAAAQTWIHLALAEGPPQLEYGQPTVVRVSDTNRLILYGRNANLQNEIWVLTNSNGLEGAAEWIKLWDQSQGGPTHRGNHAAVYDPWSNRMITFGGCGGQCTPVLNDVWVLENPDGLDANSDPVIPNWIQLSPLGPSPSPRHASAVAYDPATNRMIIFGGHTGSGDGGTTYSDVWVLSNANGLDGTPAWTQLSPEGGPPPGQYAPSSVYDAANNRLIVAGGDAQGTGLQTNATWVLSNANGVGDGIPEWTNIVPEGSLGSPPEFHFIASFYDAANNRMMVLSDPPDVWVLSNANGLDGTPTWTDYSPSGEGPYGSAGQNMAVYDPASNRTTVLFMENIFDAWVLEIKAHTLTIAAGSGGSTEPVPGTYFYDEGTEVSITASPDSGYGFGSWTGNIPQGHEDDNPITITMDSDKSITASFSAIEEENEGPCFIATAAYDSLSHPHLDILRDFRDTYLMSNRPGRVSVNFYYKYSPFVAELIAKNKVLKAAVRFSLMPVIVFSYSMLHFGPVFTTFIFLFISLLPIPPILFCLRRMRRPEAKSPKALASQY